MIHRLMLLVWCGCVPACLYGQFAESDKQLAALVRLYEAGQDSAFDTSQKIQTRVAFFQATRVKSDSIYSQILTSGTDDQKKAALFFNTSLSIYHLLSQRVWLSEADFAASMQALKPTVDRLSPSFFPIRFGIMSYRVVIERHDAWDNLSLFYCVWDELF